MRSWFAGSYEMSPRPSDFSRPPSRCSRPGVPGMAHGRASVLGSRRYGQNSPSWFGPVANGTEMSGSSSSDGMSQGSEPFARTPSDSRITGVRYSRAIRAASIAALKQCDGERAARTGSGASPCRPYIAWSRSACSVFVGRPVEGPPRWMSTTMSGSSREAASPIVSAFRSIPGPLVQVTARLPPNAAPTAAPAAAISSSAWKVRTPKFFRRASSCSTSEAGVIGYEPRKRGSLARCAGAEAMSPQASAWFPVTFR